MNRTAAELADRNSPYYRKYPGTCDIDLTLIIAERMAEGDSPVTEAYQVPDEFALTEAELAELLDDRAISVTEAIDAGHPHVYVLETGEESEGMRILGIYTEAGLARGDFAGFAAEMLDRFGARDFDQVRAEGPALVLQLACDQLRLGPQLVTTQAQATPRDSYAIDLAWSVIDAALPALPR